MKAKTLTCKETDTKFKTDKRKELVRISGKVWQRSIHNGFNRLF